MRVLILTHRIADASFRVRWQPFLGALGETEVAEIPRRGRRAVLERARAADLVVLHRRLLVGRDFRRLRRRARRLVYDFDDALCYRPRPPFRSWMRARRFFRTVAGADAVFAGNRILAGLARLRARKVFVIPSTVDAGAYAPAPKRPEFTAVWIGQRATLPYLEPVAAAVTAAGIALRVVADAAPPGTEHVPWTAATEARSLAECHVGLMPVPADPFARGKCGYKILQYGAAGLPAVASPVGVNRYLGALPARSPAEFVAALERLRADAAERDRLGRAARSLVTRRYAAASLAERLRRILEIVALQR